MNITHNARFREEVERWSAMILENGLVEKWMEGAIYPCEMAFFLATCVSNGVEVIVESGRQDGYSTEILGEFGKLSPIRVISIDIEFDRDRGARCRQRLEHLPVKMIIGDAFEEVGKLVMQEPAPMALLLDGPKLWGAISILSAAATWPTVRVLAVHNLDSGYTTRAFMEKEVAEPIFYEDVVQQTVELPNWSELKRREVIHTTSLAAARAGQVSGLGVVVVTEQNRSRLAHFRHPHFRTYPPAFVRSAWRLGMFSLLKQTFRLTNRFLGTEKY